MVNMPPKNCKTQSPDSDDPKCHKADELANLIAELCVSAPSETVKSCLRVYEYGKSIKQIEKELERETRDSLDQTAKFLEIPNYLDKTKKPLAHLIVCRIQNLLPEDCNICHERYRIKLSEPTLVECEVCLFVCLFVTGRYARLLLWHSQWPNLFCLRGSQQCTY